MKKSHLLITVVFLSVFFAVSSSEAITVGLELGDPALSLGDQLIVDLTISGLGDGEPDSVSIFDMTLAYDSSLLSFASASYGDPVLGDQLDLFAMGSYTETNDSGVTVSLYELSYDWPWDIDDYQAGAFTLASLTFDTLMAGTGTLDILINSLGDAWGDTLDATVQAAEFEITPETTAVPEPSAYFLFGSGCIFFGTIIRRRGLGKRPGASV